MAKKKINIVLIIVVLGLWGTVGYRTINGYFGVTSKTINAEAQNREIPLKKINKDTFELARVARDPFLNPEHQTAFDALRIEASDKQPPRKKNISAVYKTDSERSWPVLTYYGYMAAKQRNDEVVLLKIDSKLCKLKINTPLNGLMVRKKYKDSIEVCFNSETKIIRIDKS